MGTCNAYDVLVMSLSCPYEVPMMSLSSVFFYYSNDDIFKMDLKKPTRSWCEVVLKL